MAELKGNVLEKAKNIKLLAFDVDGVMTDGSVTYDENGVEYKTFNVKDGQFWVAKVCWNDFDGVGWCFVKWMSEFITSKEKENVICIIMPFF